MTTTPDRRAANRRRRFLLPLAWRRRPLGDGPRATGAPRSQADDRMLADIGLERGIDGRLLPLDRVLAPTTLRAGTGAEAPFTTTQSERTTMTNLDTVRRFLAGTHSNSLADVDVIDDTVAEGVTCHGFPGFPNGEFQGREAYKAFFRVFQASFSEMAFTTVALYEAAGFVSAHWSCEATFSGAFAGIAPDRRRLHFDGVAVYRMENGLIAETWLSFPSAMLMAQLPGPTAQAA
jgi:predicted ester cyclase